MGEVYEEELSLDHWVDVHGGKQPFGEIHLEKCEILSEESKDDWSIKQEIHEATGNEGVSMERWYRQGDSDRPRDRYFAILAVKVRLGDSRARADGENRQEARCLATCLIGAFSCAVSDGIPPLPTAKQLVKVFAFGVTAPERGGDTMMGNRMESAITAAMTCSAPR